MKSRERHELKTDKFADTMVALGEALNKYRRHVIVIVVIVVVGILGVLWFWHSKAAETADLWRRMSDVEDPLSMMSPEARTKDLLDKAIDLLKAVDESAGNSPAGIYAQLKTGDYQYEAKEYADAANSYRRILDNPEAADIYKQFAAKSLGPALEQAGKWEEAVTFYKAQAAGKEGAAAAELHWSISRCLDRLKRADEAAKARAEAIKLAPDSTWAELARVDAALASQPAAQTPEPPQPKPEEKPKEGAAAPTPATGPTEATKPAEAAKPGETANPSEAAQPAAAEKSAPAEKPAPPENAPAAK